MSAREQRGFTLIEILIAFALLSMFVLLGVSTLATRPGEARAAALGFQALLRDAHVTSQNNGDVSQPTGGMGATIAVSESNGETVLQLYRNRSVGADGASGSDTTVPPLRTHASLRLISTNVDPPFALRIAPTGFITISTHSTSSGSSGEKMTCLESGVIVEFHSSSWSERHKLDCLTGTIDVNEFLPDSTSS